MFLVFVQKGIDDIQELIHTHLAQPVMEDKLKQATRCLQQPEANL